MITSIGASRFLAVRIEIITFLFIVANITAAIFLKGTIDQSILIVSIQLTTELSAIFNIFVRTYSELEN